MNVSRKDFAQDRKRFRAEAVESARGFIGRKVHNVSTGKEINITRRGVKHTLHSAETGLLMASTRLPDLLRVARKTETQPDRRNRRNVRAVHIYEADIFIDQEPNIAHMVILEDDKGNQFYDLALIKKKDRGQRGREENPCHHRHPNTQSFNKNIDHNAGKNKPA